MLIGFVEGRREVGRGDVSRRQGEQRDFAQYAAHRMGCILRQAAQPVGDGLGLHLDGQGVLPPGLDSFGKVELERHHPALVLADRPAVHLHRGVRADAVETQLDPLSLPVVGQAEPGGVNRGLAFADLEALHGPFARDFDRRGGPGGGAEIPRAVQRTDRFGHAGHRRRPGRQGR